MWSSLVNPFHDTSATFTCETALQQGSPTSHLHERGALAQRMRWRCGRMWHAHNQASDCCRTHPLAQQRHGRRHRHRVVACATTCSSSQSQLARMISMVKVSGAGADITTCIKRSCRAMCWHAHAACVHACPPHVRMHEGIALAARCLLLSEHACALYTLMKAIPTSTLLPVCVCKIDQLCWQSDQLCMRPSASTCTHVRALL
jgi:hypothetical protein